MTRSTLVIAAIAALVLPTTAGAQDLEHGKEIFRLCTQCHGEDGAGNPLSLAPSIAGQPQWYVKAQLTNFRKGLRGVHPNDLGGLRMYPMSLSLKTDQDVDDVAAYVAGMPAPKLPATVEGNAEAGKTTFATCAACHGPEGAGNEAVHAPRLAGTSDWYLVESLKKFKAGIRGGNPANQNSVLMRGMSMSLANDEAIHNVVAYIHTLGK